MTDPTDAVINYQRALELAQSLSLADKTRLIEHLRAIVWQDTTPDQPPSPLIYSVKTQIGHVAITPSHGKTVYEAIYPHLIAKQSVELDFTDVTIIAPPFLNAAIGQLLHDLTREQLDQYLKITNLLELGASILQRVIENADRYYRDENYRHAIDRINERETMENDD